MWNVSNIMNWVTLFVSWKAPFPHTFFAMRSSSVTFICLNTSYTTSTSYSQSNLYANVSVCPRKPKKSRKIKNPPVYANLPKPKRNQKWADVNMMFNATRMFSGSRNFSYLFTLCVLWRCYFQWRKCMIFEPQCKKGIGICHSHQYSGPLLWFSWPDASCLL